MVGIEIGAGQDIAQRAVIRIVDDFLSFGARLFVRIGDDHMKQRIDPDLPIDRAGPLVDILDARLQRVDVGHHELPIAHLGHKLFAARGLAGAHDRYLVLWRGQTHAVLKVEKVAVMGDAAVFP